MPMFIRVDVDPEVASQPEVAKKLVEVCPVDIFGLAPDQSLQVIEKALDECVLCGLCVEAAPAGTVKVIKLYEGE